MSQGEDRWLVHMLSRNSAFRAGLDPQELPVARTAGRFGLITCMDPRINTTALGIAPFAAGTAATSTVRIIRTIGAMAEDRNPSTSEVIGFVPEDGREVAGAAIDAAVRAFNTGAWSRSPRLRAASLLEAADHLVIQVDAVVPDLVGPGSISLDGEFRHVRSSGREEQAPPRPRAVCTRLAVDGQRCVIHARKGSSYLEL